MHTTLYRKWRPADFDSVIGQKTVTDVLRYEIRNGKTTHAYLFCGSRGTGKTTCAKILAKALNCESPVNGNPCGKCASCRLIEKGLATDIIEMDAASNTGVDYIRDIRDEVVYTPAALKKKVYIIDEVHMLSVPAFNALLKTLEEPPEHVVFIFATTEFHKLPVTIVSRCQRFDFRRISVEDICSRLRVISDAEGIDIDDEGLGQIARQAKGGMRDAISLLELCAGAGKKLNAKEVQSILGIPDRLLISSLIKCVLRKDYGAIFRGVSAAVAACPDIRVFWQDLIDYYRDMLLLKVSDRGADILELTEEELAKTRECAGFFTVQRLTYHMRLLEDAFVRMDRAGDIQRAIAETTLIRMSDDALSTEPDALLSRISALEKRLAQGAAAAREPEIPAPEPIPVPAAGESEIPETAGDEQTSETDAAPAAEELECWPDVVAEAIRESPLTANFLNPSRAFTDGRGIVVEVQPFAVTMMGADPGMLTLLCMLIAENGGPTVLPDEIEFRAAEKIKEADGLEGL